MYLEAHALLLCATVLLFTVTPWTIPEADAQSLPSGWKVIDIGSPPAPGSATFVSPTFTVMSKGFDVNRYADQFTFAYRAISGDFAITARLKTLPNVDPWAQAGVMLRKSLDADAGHVFVFGAPGNGVVVRARKTKAAGTFQTLTGAATVPVWLKLERRSSVVTAFRSTDGKSWTRCRRYTLSLATDLLVGLAVASHSRTLGLTAAFDGVKVASPNVPPAVSLTSPANGSSYTSPASVAFGGDGIRHGRDDREGGLLRRHDPRGHGHDEPVCPHVDRAWSPAPTSSRRSRPTTQERQRRRRRGRSRSQADCGHRRANVAPTVSMTSPSNGASFVAGASVTFAATASDTDGTIQKVQFYLGTTLVATDTTSPYSTTWPAVVGSHSVSAVATDNQGAVTVSAWRDFTVTATALPGKAIFKPASPADAVNYYVFEIFAAGANPSVAAPIATQNIGVPPVVAGESSADVRATIVALAPGNYIATVAAMTSEGKLRSNTFAFTR